MVCQSFVIKRWKLSSDRLSPQNQSTTWPQRFYQSGLHHDDLRFNQLGYAYVPHNAHLDHPNSHLVSIDGLVVYNGLMSNGIRQLRWINNTGPDHLQQAFEDGIPLQVSFQVTSEQGNAIVSCTDSGLTRCLAYFIAPPNGQQVSLKNT